MAFGAAQASFWSVDRDYAQSSIEQLTKGGKYYKRLKAASGVLEFLRTLVEPLRILGEYSELGTRIGHFKRVKAELAKKNGGKIDRDILITAALESRDLMDYARGGSSSRNWNALSAFANASIQGVDKFYRTFDIRKAWSKDENVRKEWERAMIRLAITAILPTIFLFMLNGDEDWYQNDLQDWEKETHWIIGQNLRIPKGADVGIRFVSNFTEALLNNLKNNEPMTYKKVLKPLWDAMPDLTPTALQPIFECAANYDLFTNSPVVPYRLQRLPENLQFDSRTSWAAKKIGDSSFAKFFFDNGISPQKIDHFIFGYTGNMGKGASGVIDSTIGDKEMKIPATDWLPLIGGFLRVPYKNPKIINDYYELLDEQTKLHNEYKMTQKMPDGYNPSLYKRLWQTQKSMSKLSKIERSVLENPNIGSSEKESRQEKIQKQRVALVEKFMR